MPPPKSPLDKPSSSHNRTPESTRRSSSEKSTAKHGIKAGQAPQGLTKDPMSESASAGATAPISHKTAQPSRQNDQPETAERPERDTVGSSSSSAVVIEETPREDVGAVRTGTGEERPELAKITSMEELERLRAAVNARIQANLQRDRLARKINEREVRAVAAAKSTKDRVSPINEETVSPSLDKAFATPPPTGLETTSMGSGNTIREGWTPAALPARTPAYPFPPMKTPRQFSYTGHKPFTTLSPTVNPANYAGGSFVGSGQDQVQSGSATPAASLQFQPHGSYQQTDLSSETPNLYDLSLMLMSEPGLDSWWTTVSKIAKDLYKADRVTLTIPADPTDVENVPWAQKATFNVIEKDGLSLTYLQRGSSLVPSSVGTNDETPASPSGDAEESPPLFLSTASTTRPDLQSRHSYTAYEDTKRESVAVPETRPGLATRPITLARAKSYATARPDLPPRIGTLKNAELSLHSLQHHFEFEERKTSSPEWEESELAQREIRGRVFPVLQALDFEADPLIDNAGVIRVLDRGKSVCLSRVYPYLEHAEPIDERSGGSGSGSGGAKKSSHRRGKQPKEISSERPKKSKAADLSSRIQSFLGKQSKHARRSSRSQISDKGKSIPTSGSMSMHEDEHPASTASTAKYDEYEQGVSSAWSQSPAPSPAVRVETDENPFFANTTVDEASFEPEGRPSDTYSQVSQIEAIGVDRSWTVLHIPLMHPLLSKPVHAFRLDTAAMKQKATSKGKNPEQKDKPKDDEGIRAKQTPIAILSLLSPLVPYPSNLKHSLDFLAPHLATSYSLCRHHSNLETEIAGLSRKGPRYAGFGAIVSSSRPLDDRLHLGQPAVSPLDDNSMRRSTGGSITSPSDYSGLSRSTVGSSAVTPSWEREHANISVPRDKRYGSESPAQITTEGYFASRVRPCVGRVDTGPASSVTGARKSSNQSSPVETKSHYISRSIGEESVSLQNQTSAVLSEVARDRTDQDDARSSTRTARQETRERAERPARDNTSEASEARDSSPSHADHPPSSRRQPIRLFSSQSSKGERPPHTQLHSYGADFSSTFQSLLTTSSASITKHPPAPKEPSRAGSATPSPTDMPPPSDRVKGLMLDSLPAHLFVATPPNGGIVWVNNRYLTYRGQTVEDLHQDPWQSLHPDEREEYLKAWSHAIRTGEQFSKQIRIKRFDGNYRWFYTRAIGQRNHQGVIVQWYGTHMDIHDQHLAEVKAARQEEIEGSEAKHRQLANLIPQITFAATEDEGITFANEQWLSYTGQSFEDALGLGFMDYVHPEDIARCHIPNNQQPPTPRQAPPRKPRDSMSRVPSENSSGGKSSSNPSIVSEAPTESTVKGIYPSLSRNNSSSSGSLNESPMADLAELARNGVIKIITDSDGRQSYETEVRLKSKKGVYRWHLVRCVEVENIALGSGDGSWFGACTDIHDHKLLEKTLKETMDIKARFLSNMSHEIRTPLIGISGMVNFLQDTALTDEQEDYCSTIRTSADSLLSIINDILDLSKVDAGMMKLSYDWFRARTLVEDVNEILYSLAITKRIELNYMVDVDVPEWIKGDKLRIRQVLLNVVGNAIKFTTMGEVFSRCKVVVDPSIGENEIMLEHSIIDTGTGFTQKEAEMIFKPFSQIDGSSTRSHGGTGLGLVISRQLVELHGGKMEGTAVPGKGSTFTFTAKFGLPTEEDHPSPSPTPTLSSKDVSTRSSVHSLIPTDPLAKHTLRQTSIPILAGRQVVESPAAASPRTDSSLDSPSVVSSGSSAPSFHSLRSHATHRSSSSSGRQSLVHFGQAAKESSSDSAQMKLALPERQSSLGSTPTLDLFSRINSGLSSVESAPSALTPIVSRTDVSRQSSFPSTQLKHFRPPMYSILIVCPQIHSLEATKQHIEMTLPPKEEIPHNLVAKTSVAEARDLVGGEDPVVFTHIVLNLGSNEEIVTLIDQIFASVSLPQTIVIVLSDPVQRQEIMKMATDYDYDQLAKDNRVIFVFKPVKPSRFAVIFDPDRERALSTDLNRSSAQQQIADQKQSYLDVTKRLGNKGFKVLLVEDNLVNQKVLLKFLAKIGIAVELALDGLECVNKVFSHDHSFYSLILCDLHMPNKDGYETCRDIRAWEAENSYTRMPIIALSANVMADVMEKCVATGFNTYVTKPVDFKALSITMGDLLDPGGLLVASSSSTL